MHIDGHALPEEPGGRADDLVEASKKPLAGEAQYGRTREHQVIEEPHVHGRQRVAQAGGDQLIRRALILDTGWMLGFIRECQHGLFIRC